MYKIDTETRAITLPAGDTLLFRIHLKGGSQPEGTVGVFAVCTSRSKPATLLSRSFPVEGDALTIHLSNADTRELPVGRHLWDVRLVTDPEYDAEGNVRCDDASDNVLSLFSGPSAMPDFTVTAVAKDI